MHDNFQVFLTNARSLGPKINNTVEAHDIILAVITEFSLQDGVVLERDVTDLSMVLK